MMKTNDNLSNKTTTGLFINCEQSIIEAINSCINDGSSNVVNREEFIQQTIIEKLQREAEKDDLAEQFKRLEAEMNNMNVDDFFTL